MNIHSVMPLNAVARKTRVRRRPPPARNATRSSAPRSTSSPSAATSTPRSPTSPAPPASPPAPSTSTSRARTTCWSRSSSAACAKALAEGRAAVADLARSARAAAPPRARPPRAARQRSQPRDRLPGRAAAVDQVHGALLVDAAARLPRPDPRGDRRRPARRAVPRRHQADRPRPRCSSARSTRWRPTGF